MASLFIDIDYSEFILIMILLISTLNYKLQLDEYSF